MSEIAHTSAVGAARHPERRFALRTLSRGSVLMLVVAAAVVAGLAVLPFVAPRSLLQDLFAILTLLSLAQFWNLLAGYAGLVSIGQQAFVGFGGYALFAATILLGLDPLLAVLVAGAGAALLALPCAFLVFRLRNAYFAVGTWVVAEVLRLVAAQIKVLGGGTGISLPKAVAGDSLLVQAVMRVTGVRAPAARDMAAYWLALALAVGAIAAVYVFLRSRQGLALAAIRDNEAAAGSVGVEPLRLKLMVYLVSAAGAGLTGALIYLQKARISPDAAFSVTDWTAFVFFVVIIGGIATIEGPIVGVLVFWLLQNQLAAYGAWYLMLLGATAIAAMLFFPRGIWGTFAAVTDVHPFPTRRILVVRPEAGS